MTRVTRWEATYLGTQIALAAGSAEGYEILDAYDLPTWQSGGCAVLAEALRRTWGAQIYGLMRRDGVVDHVVAKLDTYYFDADGAYTSFEMKEKHEANEGHRTTLKKLTAPVEGILCPLGAIEATVGLLDGRGVVPF